MQELIQRLNNEITVADEMLRTLKCNLIRRLHSAIQRSDDIDCSLIECRLKIERAMADLAEQIAEILKIARQLQELSRTELSQASIPILLHTAAYNV